MDRNSVYGENPITVLDGHRHIRYMIRVDIQLGSAESTHPSSPDFPHSHRVHEMSGDGEQIGSHRALARQLDEVIRLSVFHASVAFR
jgi:hypothetical protein